MIHDEIRSLLDAPPQGDEAPTIDAIEHTLTAGYARALALEAERWRLERRIAEVAATLGGKSPGDEHSELAGDHRVVLAVGDQLQHFDLALRELGADRGLDLRLSAGRTNTLQDLRGDRRRDQRLAHRRRLDSRDQLLN